METHENQDGVEVLITPLHVFCVVLHSLLFVHCVEIKLGVTIFDWLEIRLSGHLDAISGKLAGFSFASAFVPHNSYLKLVGPRNRFCISKTHH